MDKESTITTMVKCNFFKNRYTGNWKNDKKHGKGVYELPNGEKYEGHYEED